MGDIDYEDLKRRGFLKQKQDGFFILRTRMSRGAYKSEGLEKLAGIARKYAKGFVHATVRQGVEIPFIKLEDIPKIEAELKTAEVLMGTSGARIRATVTCPGNNWCRFGLIDTFGLAERIEKEAGAVCGTELPHKFKIAVSGCPNGCARPQASDIGIHGSPLGYVIYLGGSGGRNPKAGIKLDKVFTEDEVLTVVKKVIEFYKAGAAPRQRLGSLIEQSGLPALQT